jgi:hypothetical protein
MRYLILLLAIGLALSSAPVKGKNGHHATVYHAPPAHLPDFSETKLFFEQNKIILKNICLKMGVPMDELAAVAAPEHHRYGRFRDWLETTGLEVGYVQGGKTYVDFSIGFFQMKPSFAEEMEAAIAQSGQLRALFTDLLPSFGIGERTGRSERLGRLKDLQTQWRYLCAFWLLQHERYPELIGFDSEDRIAFVATAYNLGPSADLYDIHAWQKIRAFPYGRRSEVPQCSYAEAALSFYRAQKYR